MQGSLMGPTFEFLSTHSLYAQNSNLLKDKEKKMLAGQTGQWS